MAQGTIDSVMSDLKRYRENIDEEFKVWHNLAMTMTQSVAVQPSVSQLVKGWTKFRSNVENESPSIKKLQQYHFLMISIHNFQTDYKIEIIQIYLFCYPPQCRLIFITQMRQQNSSFQGHKNEMTNKGVHFSSEVRRWFNPLEQ